MMWGSTDKPLDLSTIHDDIKAALEQISKFPNYTDLRIIIPKEIWEWEKWRLGLPFSLYSKMEIARLSMEKIELEKWLKWYNLSKLGRRVRKRIKELKRLIMYYPFSRKFELRKKIKGLLYNEGK